MADKNKQQNQEQRQQQKQGKPQSNFPLAYELRTTWRFFYTLLREGILAAAFVAPIYAYFYFTGVKVIPLPTDFWTLWGLGLLVFLLQSVLFKKGG